MVIAIQQQPRQHLWCCHHGTVTVRVHPVHLMNVEQHRRPPTVGPSWSAYAIGPLKLAAKVLHSLSPLTTTQLKSWDSYHKR